MRLIPQNLREISNLFGKFARGTGTETAVLDWPVDLGATENLHIEERVLSLSDEGELQITWSPLPGTSITPNGKRVTANLRGLKPGTLYTVRVTSGKDAEASVLFVADFRTAPIKPLFTTSPRTPLLVIALCGLLFAIWRARRKPRPPRKKAK